jgi:hypothetical protein
MAKRKASGSRATTAPTPLDPAGHQPVRTSGAISTMVPTSDLVLMMQLAMGRLS